MDSAWIKHELKSVALATAFFASWISVFILIKTLILAEYEVGFVGWSKALTGALILGKVALILEKVPLGAWVRARPAWVGLLLRTGLYSLGVLLVLLLEHGISGRHEHGGFLGAIHAAWHEASGAHIAANAITLSGALFVFNLLTLLSLHLGDGGLLKVLRDPEPEPPPPHEAATPPSV